MPGILPPAVDLVLGGGHDAVRTAADAAEIIADRGVPAAQNEIHGRR
jgi:hypothetical protein